MIPSSRLILFLPLLFTGCLEPEKTSTDKKGDASWAALTQEEIDDGWIELFDGATLFGWKQVGEGKWTVENGVLSSATDNQSTLVTTTSFFDYDLKVDYRVRSDCRPQLLIGCGREGETVKGTWCEALPEGRPARSSAIDENTPGKPIEAPPTKNKRSTSTDSETRVELHVRVAAGRVTELDFAVKRDDGRGRGGEADLSRNTKPPSTEGHLAILGGEYIAILGIKLRPLKTSPLFNGKDLAGWKELPDSKAKFTVSDQGFLQVKNGPGNLQTEGQWADFVLQADCRGKGEALNGRIFFRSPAEDCQQGYSVQIHENFDENNPREYTIEDFDPKTNEPAGSRKEKFAAADYGTGGIHGLQPARKQVAREGEWLSLAVVAHGRHMGAWVNGIMVSDWTDNRPLDASALKGCRLKKGPISLQGNEAISDMSFRNIRIAELPPVVEK